MPTRSAAKVGRAAILAQPTDDHAPGISAEHAQEADSVAEPAGAEDESADPVGPIGGGRATGSHQSGVAKGREMSPSHGLTGRRAPGCPF